MKAVSFSELVKHFIPYLSEDDLDEMQNDRELMSKKKDELGIEKYIEWLKEQGY